MLCDLFSTFSPTRFVSVLAALQLDYLILQSQNVLRTNESRDMYCSRITIYYYGLIVFLTQHLIVFLCVRIFFLNIELRAVYLQQLGFVLQCGMHKLACRCSIFL